MIKKEIKKLKKVTNTYISTKNEEKMREKLSHLIKHVKRNSWPGNLNTINGKLYYLLLNSDTIVNAWNKLKNNKGSLPPGIDAETIQGFNLEKARKITQKLKKRTFVPNPVRKRWIAKPGKKNEKKPLNVSTFEDRLVQEALREILEAIYEPEFKNLEYKTKFRTNNFGFRPNKSTWDAVSNIASKGQRLDWIIEGNISQAYDTVDHDILINILNRRITDKKFLKLIRSYLEAGVMEDFHITHSLKKVAQGNIVSPILFNIYMFEMDKFVEQFLRKTIKHLQPKKTYQIYLENYNKYRKLQFQTLSKNTSNKEYELLYVRYASDWVLGITGPKKVALYLKNKIESYLKHYLKLSLSQEKTSLTHIKTDPVYFLGYELLINNSNNQILRFPVTRLNNDTNSYKTTIEVRKTTSLKFRILPDKNRILKQMKEHGFLSSTNFPREKPAWSTLKDYQIVLKYKQIFQGLIQYYLHCDLNRTIHYVEYILLYSCAKTLAQKHKTTVKSIFQKHGKRLLVYSKSSNGKSLSIDFPKEIDIKTKMLQNSTSKSNSNKFE